MGSALGMAEAMPFQKQCNNRFLGRAKDALGRNDKTSKKLAAPACAPATATPVATAVAGHDAAAEAAGGGVAQIDDAG